MLNFIQEKKFFIIALIIFFSFAILTGERKEEELIIQEEFLLEKDSKQAIKEENEGETNLLFIHIAGNVGKPGLFQIEEGSRLNDLIIPAEIKDIEILDKYFNRAELLSDGEKIYIPFPEEIENMTAENFISESSGNSEIVNINKDPIEDLIKLPGIGETKARDIISFREKNGKFKKIDDIIQVKGIGNLTFEKIKELIKT